jgi:hypothetical protein
MNLAPRHFGIIIAGIATAYLHLSLYSILGIDPIVLNGLGYLALLGAYFLPIPFFQQKRNLVWRGLLGYTALTFVLWIIMGNKDFYSSTSAAVGYYAKAAELFLLGFLWADKPKS